MKKKFSMHRITVFKAYRLEFKMMLYNRGMINEFEYQIQDNISSGISALVDKVCRMCLKQNPPMIYFG